MYCALKLNGEAGELAEHVGKAMRDDAFGPEPLTTERRELIIKELGDVLWYLSAIADGLGISMNAVALKNLQKLKDRTDRDALRGSGDER
jgi:NTP pyrophosphatase (non-canonical NTP hydrolase)